jgi:hypothetical protein
MVDGNVPALDTNGAYMQGHTDGYMEGYEAGAEYGAEKMEAEMQQEARHLILLIAAMMVQHGAWELAYPREYLEGIIADQNHIEVITNSVTGAMTIKRRKVVGSIQEDSSDSESP